MSFYQSEKMMLMHPGTDDVVKHRMLQAKMLSREARGERLNLGKKMSVPRDVMMEELNLPSNRGSRMFQERQKRLERFTLENTPDTAHFNTSAHLVSVPPPQITQQPRGGKENQAFSTPGKHSLVMNLQKTVSKKGSPDVLAPGYSGPLKEIPREKFNTTVIPRLYCSPWREALGRNEDLLEALNAQLAPLPQRYQPANYRCFNREWTACKSSGLFHTHKFALNCSDFLGNSKSMSGLTVRTSRVPVLVWASHDSRFRRGAQ
ncbi:myozenin-2-like isoform X2 [Nerophis ophidion]|uniref:myozenin-2-like isoform X2 n=1 Tax=Nerophis ophidion TaxID=159077 RepID=UPI002ADFDDF1|nr:myozenin-2-like isoform X2 [Nerophis ophidion]